MKSFVCFAVLDGALNEDLTEMLTFEQRAGNCEGGSHKDTWGKNLSGHGKREAKALVEVKIVTHYVNTS